MIKRKKRIFICHNEEDIRNFDVRENMPVWRELNSLFYQFKKYTSKIKLNKEDKERLELLTFYLEKVVEHYDIEVMEFSFSVLCSIIESLESTQKFHGWKCFKKVLVDYFEPKYTKDKKFMKKMWEVYYPVGRCSFSHSAKRLHVFAQIGSQANISLELMRKQRNYDLFGNKHLFQIAVEGISSCFQKKQIIPTTP